jgi:hypothetical protein
MNEIIYTMVTPMWVLCVVDSVCWSWQRKMLKSWDILFGMSQHWSNMFGLDWGERIVLTVDTGRSNGSGDTRREQENKWVVLETIMRIYWPWQLVELIMTEVGVASVVATVRCTGPGKIDRVYSVINEWLFECGTHECMVWVHVVNECWTDMVHEYVWAWALVSDHGEDMCCVDTHKWEDFKMKMQYTFKDWIEVQI